jgi:hypothetical protein
MRTFVTHRRRFLAVAAASAVALALVATPAGRSLCLNALSSLIEFSARYTHLNRSFPRDRLDPTCPQCM